MHEVVPLLASIDGVEHVVVDDAHGTIVLICAPDAPPDSIPAAAAEALIAADLDPDSVRLELVVRLERRPQQRVRFAGVTRTLRPDHRYQFAVTLDWQGSHVTALADAERGEALELKAVASAALDALRQIVPEELDVRVAGVKLVRSFDAELIVASLYRPGNPPQQYVGAVVVGGDAPRAAAIAVLSALNRLLGNYLAR